MIFISYYTKDTPYKAVMNDCLLPSLKEWGLTYDIEAIEDRGNWQKNTGYKCEFIKKMLLKHKESVCFLDSDALIMQFPSLICSLPNDFDLAYHFFNWYGHWRNQWDNTSKIELLSGTMVFNYNDKVLALLNEWIYQVNSNINKWEQKVLEEIVYARDDLNIIDLPAEYCTVLMQDNSIPKYVKDPIIIHTQASRKYKHWWRDRKIQEERDRLDKQ